MSFDRQMVEGDVVRCAECGRYLQLGEWYVMKPRGTAFNVAWCLKCDWGDEKINVSCFSPKGTGYR